ALEQVLERAKVTDKDKLIFLGDYVDGWSESSQVINALIELSQKQECIFIKGNHDLYCEEWLSFGHKPEMWLLNGGVATMESYADYSDEEIDK
ncbi:metallophosphoesterase, partial [Bacillus cereus group sp. BC311]|uniref:metallophosphoesterase n=1 Tax=Bacillus cereus group sp. BC311 TaxID=3445316 RepID=UPI003F697B5A